MDPSHHDVLVPQFTTRSIRSRTTQSASRCSVPFLMNVLLDFRPTATHALNIRPHVFSIDTQRGCRMMNINTLRSSMPIISDDAVPAVMDSVAVSHDLNTIFTSLKTEYAFCGAIASDGSWREPAKRRGTARTMVNAQMDGCGPPASEQPPCARDDKPAITSLLRSCL